MREDMIVELARIFLDTPVTIYFQNEYIKGVWFSIDMHTNAIGVKRESGNRSVYIDIDTIVAVEVDDGYRRDDE